MLEETTPRIKEVEAADRWSVSEISRERTTDISVVKVYDGRGRTWKIEMQSLVMTKHLAV
jgi:hypothetical protein